MFKLILSLLNSIRSVWDRDHLLDFVRKAHGGKKEVLVMSLILCAVFLSFVSSQSESSGDRVTFWQVQSIDTMKYSRDLSREKLREESFDVLIDSQMRKIAAIGATHVSIGTPYDEEFLPILKRWVLYARKYDLKVWFRGNWSGWEKWFGYKPIDRKTHTEMTRQFILNNASLFEDGDVFSSCPECENGGPGDPRRNGDVVGHRKFLIEQYNVTKEAFSKINKKVASNYNSMNGDVAALVMDRETTTALDGIVVIDHYVASPEKLVFDINQLVDRSGGRIVLGEFGAPIPDIHGKMSQKEQREWLEKALLALAQNEYVVGINYWTSVGGSTELWGGEGEEKEAVLAVRKFYMPLVIFGVIKNEIGQNVAYANMSSQLAWTLSSEKGEFRLPSLYEKEKLVISASGYKDMQVEVQSGVTQTITLAKEHEDLLFKLRKFLSVLILIG